MSKKPLLKILIIFIVLITGFFYFYKFMTYDRNYTWVKEYREEIMTIAKSTDFKVKQTEIIDIANIKRSTEKTIKIEIQKVLGNVNLMTFGRELGESTKLTLENTNGFFNCKAWCLDDHLIGLEIEYKDIDDSTFASFKKTFEKQFDNYQIIWTRL